MNLEEVIFEAAASRPEVERSAYLDAACAGQPGTRAHIEALLRSHEVSGFMEERAVGCPSPPSEHRGDVIGRYRLVEQIGEGGFGVVWMAEQLKPVTRRVALKIIKQGMDTREVIARFEAERQALAMMDHPNIARVFDAGATDRGGPYFVMELVEGIPITQFCDEQTLNTRQRLELFVEVCSAINHAHQKGVIHRDIKPSNIMVPRAGDKPVPKVIDFGIAKAIEGRLTDRTLFTRFEHFVGTPAYMSPEQTAMGGLDVDTRSDIYALGVLLYELLTGKPPFDTKLLLSSSNDEMRRIIREVEPPKPSARLATVAGTQRTTLARTRQVAPEKLNRLIEPDLDWIVIKALEKDRARRYQSANGLALDVQRFLSNEPVSAGPPSAGYRFRKFARRNRVALRVASGIASGLVAATAVSTSLAIRATKAEEQASQKASDETAARQEADQARLAAEALSTFFKGVFTSADPSLGNRDMSVVEALNRAIARMDSELSKHPEQKVDLQGSILWTLHTLGFTRQIIPLQEKRRDYYHRTLGPHHQKALGASLTLAFYYQHDLRIKEATEILEELYRYEREGWRQKRDMHLFGTLANLARCYEALGRGDEALKLNEEALAHCRTTYGDEHDMTLRLMQAVEASLRLAARFQEAKALGEQVVAIRRNQFRRENPHPLCAALWSLSDSYEATGQPERALEVREEAEAIRRSELRELRPEDRGSLYAVTRLKVEDTIAGQRYDEAVQLSRDLVGLRGNSGMPVGERPVPEARLANALLLHAAADPSGASTDTASGWVREADELIQTLLLDSVDLSEGTARVDLLSQHCHWPEAARLCRPLHEAFPVNPWVLARLGPLLIAAGDLAAYGKLCEELLHPFISAGPADLEPLLLSLAGKDDGRLLDVIARTVCLRPVSEANLRWARLLADRTAALVNDRPYHQLTRGLVAFRNGDDSAAISDMEAAIPILPATAEAGAQAVLAMARARRGDTELGTKALAEGTRRQNAIWLSERRIALHREPHEWLTAQILLREAKAMVEPGE